MASSFNVNFEDLQRILENIKIAERESAGGQLIDIITEIATGSPAIAGSPLVNAANLPLGLRHVDGSNNHLIAGAPGGVLNGAADQPFASLLQRRFVTDTGSVAYDLDPRSPVPNGVQNVLNVANNSYDPTNPQANDAGVNTKSVVDASIRTISNLIVDQTVTNPAAIAAALRQAGDPTPNETAISLYKSARDLLDPTILETDKDALRTKLSATLALHGVSVSSDGSISVEHKSADIGLSPANSSWMTIFGQFFDHGLDLVGKGGQGTVYMPLQADDPLYVPGSPTNFMALSRGANIPGINGTTPWIDQNQTYTSHPSHQVFLREYTFDANGRTVATGRLLDGASGGMPTWKEVKANALTYLGIQLDDRDVGKIPELLTDAYGKFIPGVNGFAQLVTGVSATGTPTTVEGTAQGINPTTVIARRINAAFLDDINAAAAPVVVGGVLQPDGNGVIGIGGPGATDPAVPNGLGGFTTYDNELLDAHFCGGDGRSNENIALTATHSVFHNEHNRVMEANKLTILRSGDLATINEWLRVDLASGTQLPLATASDAELQTFANGLAWEGERMFQAAKFSTEMQYQHLVFEEFARRIQPNIAPFVFTNSADLDGRIVAEFAHAVYRFGHSQLGDGIARLDNTLAANDTGLIQAFLNPEAFSSSGPDAATATGAILRGITRVVDQEIDEFVVEALRNNLLGAPLDLASLNLARGREQGIPSLNESRSQLFAMTGAVQLKPYTGWTVDPADTKSHGLFQHLKNPLSVVNLIAAYGTHPTITAASSIEAKRDAAMAIVLGIDVNGNLGPRDALQFMRGTGSWALQETGLNLVDLWVGGLAEQINEFGGQLGDTFNAIFQYQMEHLQNADRFYYLSRTQGMNLLTQLEASTFADLVMRNTDLGAANSTHLAGHIMGVPDYILELDRQVAQANYSGDASRDGLVGTSNTAEQRALLDPTAAASMFDFLLGGNANSKVMRQYGTADLNGDGFVDGNVIRFTGGEHVVLGGTEGNDAIYGDKGIDTLWGDSGDDYINPGMESDEVFGGDGDDIIVDPFGNDFLRGGRGDDVIVNGAGLDINFGEQGQDVMIAIADTTEQFGGEGNDFLMGSTAGDTQLGGEGDDWMEGGEGFDGMAGDNSELFFNSPIVGHDIMNGQGNDTDYDGENGDDIMVQGVGIQRNNGMSGFDWVIHKEDPVGANTDLTTFIPGLVATPGAAVAVTLRDRFDSVEGASGWKFNDNLKGSIRAIAGTPWFQNQLTQAGVDRITGLQQVIGGTGQVDPNAVAFGALNVNGNSEGQIFLGGDGSDTIMGGIGDDVIDGDAWLNVRLVGEYKSGYAKTGSFSANSLSEIANDLVAGGIDPGTMRAVREILYDGATNGTNPDDVNIDIAIYNDVRANYDVVQNTDGSVTVNHARGTLVDGVDRVRNVELGRFTDGDFALINYAPTGNLSFTTTEASFTGGLLNASQNFASFNPIAPILSDRNNISPTNPTGAVAANAITLNFVDQNGVALNTNGSSLLLNATTGPGQQLRQRATYTDAGGFANIVDGALMNAVVGTTAAQTLIGADIAGVSDYLFGGGAGDTLNGGIGNDYLSGGAGNDALNGGDGLDIANFAGVSTSSTILGAVNAPVASNFANASYTMSNGNVTVTTTSGGTDTLTSIEKLHFSDVTADLLQGSGVVSHTGAGPAVVVGSIDADSLSGGASGDVLLGSDGNDSLDGKGGNDKLDGGAGLDTAIYTTAYSRDKIGIAAGNITVITPTEGTDSLTNIERIAFANNVNVDVIQSNDAIINVPAPTAGSTGIAIVVGGAANQTINGNTGNDEIAGAGGDDVINGAGGIDTAIYTGSSNTTLFGLSGANLTVQSRVMPSPVAATPSGLGTGTGAATSTPDGTDTVIGVEKLQFLDGLFDLVGQATTGNNTLSYSGTNRALLFGGQGNDSLAGGSNDDLLSYTAVGTAANNATTGGGRDFMDGGANATLGDRAVFNGDASTELFRIYAVGGTANAAQLTALTTAGFTGANAINASAEIVVLRALGQAFGTPAFNATNYRIVGELANVEEITVNLAGQQTAFGFPIGTQSVAVFGNFSSPNTSLRTNTITITGDGAGVEVDVTGIESEHRVVLDAGTIIGQREQDIVGAADGIPPENDDNETPTDVVTTPVVVDTTLVDTSKAIHLGLSLQKVPEFEGDLPSDIVLRRFGTTQEQKSQFYLALTAESLRDASIDTLDVTLDLGADFFDVFQISGQQIYFSEDMAVQRQVRIDGTKVRFEGAGLSSLGEGLGKGVDSTAPIAVIALTLRDDINDQIKTARGTDRYGFLNRETWQQSLNFEVSANIDQVVFSDLVSLRDLGGDDALMSDELHVMARAAQAELSTDSTFGLGTERSVLKPGETGFTNLIRSGDTIERITQWQNDGEFSFRDFTITNIDQAGVAKAVSVFLADDATTLNTLAPDSGDGAGEVAEIRTTFMVSGQAGLVLDTSKLGFQLDAFGGYHWDTSKMELFQQKNLITFQGDLNYDGAVTMKDLAFLNAGAARGSDDARGYSRDVDANFDGELDIDDLAILDADWGRSLHQGDANEAKFLGSNQLSMASLTHQGQHHWDSSAFQAQNTIEAQETYINPITDATGALVDVQGFQALEALLQEQQQQHGLN